MGRKTIQIIWIPSTPTQIISSQQMEKLIRKGAPAYVAHCH
jgi:hypothetical protein